MNPLDNWIRQLLLRPLNEVNAEYGEIYGQVAQEIEDLFGFDARAHRARYGDVSATLLEELNRHLRGQACELAVWDAILFHVGVLPAPVAHELLDRDIAVTALGHTRQSDEVQWRLSGLVWEALVTLAWDLFTKPEYEARQLEKLLRESPDGLELLSKWEHWVLYGSEVRELEKEVIFHRWVWERRHYFLWQKHPLSVPTPEEFMELLETRQREALEEKQRLEREAEAEQLRLEREAEAKRLELERIGTTALAEAEIERILNERDPESLLALTGNLVVEKKWIERLLNCYGVKGARAIREAAVKNWEERTRTAE